MSDDYSEMTEKLNEIAASLHSQSTSGRSSSTGSVITTTPSSYSYLSPYTHVRSVYKVVHQPVSAYSFDAHITLARLQHGPGTPKRQIGKMSKCQSIAVRKKEKLFHSAEKISQIKKTT